MRLKDLIKNLQEVRKIEGKISLEIKSLASNSKKVKEGDLFVAVKGPRFDGAHFIDEAISRGACAVVLQSQPKGGCVFRRGATFIYVDDTKVALSLIARKFHKDISSKLYLIGVTGTNGKTTVTYLLESLYKENSEKVGVIGTINYRFGNRSIPAFNTTPGTLDLYSLFDNMYKDGVKKCILEVSSHSLDQGRVDGLDFDIAIFTNLSNEHLDYHKNTEDYFMAKLKLFSKIKQGGHAVVNADDVYSKKIIDRVLKEKNAKVVTYGIKQKADVCAENIKISLEGIKFKLCSKVKPRTLAVRGLTLNSKVEISSSLIGRHNVYNILACAASGIAMSMDLDKIKRAVENFTGLPGRLEKIDCGQDFLVFVDYAHTENGLKNVLKTLKELRPRRLLTVFGCGGDRDKTKRPDMGKVSSIFSDKIFITSDNPRSEEPMDIVNEIVEGMSNKNNYSIEIDRFRAIKKALKEAEKGDIVLVAGKGHETYQIFKDTTVPFDDREAIRKILTLHFNNVKV